MKRFLPKHKGILIFLLALFAGMETAYAADFSKICSTGQTLYYNIIDATNHYAEITYPGTSYSNPWTGYTRPTGNITLPSSVTYNGITYSVIRIGEKAFDGCSGLTGSLTIPSSVTSIHAFAFYGCSGFTGSLTIPNSVTSIGIFAFAICTGFTGTLTLGNSLTTIGNYAFQANHFTGSLTIPNSVTSIGDWAFMNCTSFTGTLTVGTSVSSMGKGAFHYCSGFTHLNYNAINCANLTYEDKPFEGCGGTLTIGSTVQRIPAFMFYQCTGFTGSLTIPNSVTKIGQSAFNGCGFSGTLTLGSSLTTIDGYAFFYCTDFTGSLSIPNSVTTIQGGAFLNCTGFTGTLNIGTGVTSIGFKAFKSCTGFTQVKFNAINCADVSGDDKPFEGCGGTLTIGSNVQRIPANMFSECTGFIGTLTIPASVTSIGQNAFKNCTGFTRVNFNATNCADTSLDPDTYTGPFEGCGGILSIGSSVQRIPAYIFFGCSGFTSSLTIPSSVTTIGNFAFCGCNGLTGSLTLPNSVTTIGNSAFKNCRGFTGSLTIPNSVTTIGNSAFSTCIGFTGSLTIGNSVTSIGDEAFYYCTGFTGSLTIPNSITSIEYNTFGMCTGFTGSLIIPNSVTTIGSYAFDNCRSFTGSLNIPNSVTSIGNYAFHNCYGFTGTLTIPNSVTTISDNTFDNCSHLTGLLTIPNSITSIGNYAFRYCSGFTGSLTVPNSVTSIGYNAFYYCTGFTGSLTIPNSVTYIGFRAFYDCNGLTGSLTIPNSVTTIGYEAFYGCSNLTSIIVFPETPPTLGNNVFQDVPTTIPVYVPCGSLADYQASSDWSVFTNMQCREMLTVYDGSNLSYYVPAYIYYFDEFTKSQFVIPAADLADMTGTPISSMTFYTNSYYVPYTTVSFADVYLKEVNYTEISTYEPKTSATIVYSGYFDIVSTDNGGEMTINFNTPYTYNGGNLLVGIENIENNGWMEITFYGKTVSGASVSGSSSSSLGYVQPVQQNFIPKTTFGYTPSDCSRPTGLTATEITSNSAMLNWTGFQDEYDVRYRKKPFFFEGFENGLPSDWTTIDNDGDGYNWYHYSNNVYNYAHSGTHLMESASWQGTALTPDNWLVTPLLQLQGTMKVWLSANSSAYQDEHFAIYLSTTGNSVSDFTTVLVPETVTSSEYVCYTADLSTYAGQQGYIAIRHFNCTDMDRLLMDDFGLFQNPDETDEWELALLTDNQLFIDNLEPNTEFEWQVRGRDCDGSGTYTGWSAARSFTTQCEALIVDGGNPFTEDFEGADFAPACWENIPSGSYHWSSSTSQSHSSSHSAYSRFYGDIYLVLPDIELSAHTSSAQLSFWSYNTYPSDFEEGYNTVVLLNGGTETVLWSAETVSQEWEETIVDLTDYLGQTVSLAFKYAGINGNGWYVDDVEVSVTASISLSGGDWHLIASPLESVSPDDIPGMTTGDYDLYRFEPSATDQEWRNFKNTPFSLQSGQGYLYAHGTDVTLVFDGTPYTGTVPVEVPLVYDANDSHKCWNLVGNPYKCKAYLNREYYVLNAEGTGINPEPQPIGTPIPPYTAVFVKAIATGDTVVFTKAVP